MRLALASSLCLLAAACGDIDVRSIRSDDGVPAKLEGEWLGTWQSSAGGPGGVLMLRIQDFAGEPVVSVQINHPCVKPDEYEFRATATTVELLSDDEVIFSAVIGEDRTLVGDYHCAADNGGWDAEWRRDLPQLVDLSGRWDGAITVPGEPEQQLVLRLEQGVRSGALTFDGTAELPGVLPEPIGVTGLLEFGEGTFEVLLMTLPGQVPIAFLSGIGQTAERRLDDGLMQAAIGPDLPILQATWRAEWTSHQ